MQVAKWGEDLAVRLPGDVVEGLKLKEGDEVEVRVTRATTHTRISDEEREALWDRVRALRGSLPADFVFSRDEANAR